MMLMMMMTHAYHLTGNKKGRVGAWGGRGSAGRHKQQTSCTCTGA